MQFEEEFIEAEDTRAQMTAIWNLLERAGAHEKLRAFEEDCAQSGLWEAANENAAALIRECSDHGKGVNIPGGGKAVWLSAG